MSAARTVAIPRVDLQTQILMVLRESAGTFRSRRYIETALLNRVGPVRYDRVTLALYLLERQDRITKKSLGWSGNYYRVPPAAEPVS